MSDETVKIDLSGTESMRELVVRHGSALPLKEPRVLDIVHGRLDAPADYASKRTLVSARAVVLANYERGTIDLLEDQYDPYSPMVHGKLTPNPDLVQFGINGEKVYGTKELYRFLRMRKMFLVEEHEYLMCLDGLQNFSATSQTEQRDKQDNRGNADIGFNRSTQLDVPLGFNLSIPLFIGLSPSTFRVEICVDVRDAGVQWWLESVELATLSKTIPHDEVERVLSIDSLKDLCIVEVTN